VGSTTIPRTGYGRGVSERTPRSSPVDNGVTSSECLRGGWDNVRVRRKPLLRVRKSGALLVAAVIAFVGAVPLAGAGWAYAPVLLVPAAVFLWAWRAGTDVYPDELRVRKGHISALLDNGNVIRLTGVDQGNLPKVLATAGQRVDDEKEEISRTD
jgi:hypothetical protein